MRFTLGSFRSCVVSGALLALLSLAGCDPEALGGLPYRLTPERVDGGAGDADGVTAWALFDRDTVTRFRAGEGATLTVHLGGAAPVHAVKVFGTAPYSLGLPGGATIDLGEGAEDGWNLHPLEEPIALADVPLVLTAHGEPGEVGDIELWGLGLAAAVTYAPPVDGEAEGDRPAHVNVVAATPEVLPLGPAGEADACGAVRFELARHPGAYRRMWLRMTIDGAFRPFALVRAFNEHAMVRGTFVPSDSGARYVQPIDPELLALGTNEAHFCLPDDADGSVTVSDVEIVAELDHGSNVIESATVAPYDADPTRSAIELLGGSAVTLGANEELVLAFDRLIQIDALALDAGDPSAFTARCVAEDGATSAIELAAPEAAEGDATNGLLEVTSGGTRCAGVRLGRQAGGTIASVRIFGSGAARRIDFPQIVLASAREHFGYEAWVEGWGRAPSDVGGGATLSIDGGTPVAASEGIYGRMIARSTGASDAWVVTVSARFADGSTSSRDFVLDGNAGALPGSDGIEDAFDDGLTEAERETRYGREGDTASRRFGSNEGGRVALGTHVAIDIPEGALSGQTDISIKQLARASLPALQPGMINVTAPYARGYEFLPHGQTFQKAVTITLPYQENLIPAGYTGHDVETWYYDEALERWQRLARDEVDPRNATVASVSDHFTVMINAVVVTPEHPQIASFDGNRIQGLEAANPAAGVTAIAPPEANNRGDAALNYPFAVPPGRMGMQPELGLSYNSSAGNGWVGLGWDVGVSSISVDTRFGVPRYESTRESETYALDGQQLVPEASRREGFAVRDVSAEAKEFRPQVEGGFQRIVRRGNDPANFRWEVTSRTGITSYYGAGKNESLADANATLADDAGHIFRWALREIRDAHGNIVRFDYDLARLPGDDGLEGRELYLRTVHYTLDHADDSGVYQVHFCAASGRPDPIISARGGFKEIIDRLLGRVEVHYSRNGAITGCDASKRTTQVRAWRLEYGQDPFGKAQLHALSQEGAGGAEAPWNVHRFEYFQDVVEENGDYVGFAPSPDPVVISGDAPDSGFSLARTIAAPFTGADMAPDVSMLGGNVARSAGMHFYIGFNGSTPQKNLSFGGKIGASFTQSEGIAALIDIDGDDLPDRVYCERRDCWYNRNLTAVNGYLSFADDSVAIQDLDGVFRERSFDFNVGPEAHVLQASIYANQSFSFTRGIRYLSDVNADGLVDVVDGSNVLFNRLDDGGIPAFAGTSAGTPVPIGATTARTEAGLTEIMAEYENLTGPVDTLRIWEAVADGTVRIRGAVTPTLGTAVGDGFDAAIESVRSTGGGYPSERVWEHAFDPGATEAAHDLELEVDAGDFVIFRLHARRDGAGDRVLWDPEVAYTTGLELMDENGLPARRFRASEDFVLAGRDAAIEAPYDGEIHVTGTLRKLGATTDHVRLQVLRNDTVAATITLGAGAAGVATLDANVDVSAQDKLRVRVATDTPIDLRQLVFEETPRATYTSATDAAGDSIPVIDSEGDPIYEEDLPFDMSTFSIRSYPPIRAYVPDETATLQVNGVLIANVAGSYVVAAKSGGRLLAKTVVPSAFGTFSLSVPVVEGEEVYFTVNGTAPGEVPLLMTLTARPTAKDTITLPWHAYSVRGQTHLPRPYRGWMAAAYKPDDAGFAAPIDGDVLFGEGDFDEDDQAREESDSDADGGVGADGGTEEGTPEFAGSKEDRRPWMRAIANPEPCDATDPSADPDQSDFEQANPLACEHPDEPYWVGPEDAVFVTAGGMGTSLLGPDVSALGASGDGGASGNNRGVIRISRGTNTAVGGGVSIVGAGVADSTGFGVQDFLDMNGDGFPDIVTRDEVAYSMPHGGLGETRGFGAGGDVRDSLGRMMTIGAGASIPRSKQNGSGTQGVATTRSAEGSQSTRSDPNFGISINGAGGSSETLGELLDVNGDGLPDRVTVAGSGDSRRILVRLNLGYRFAPTPVEWTGAGGGIHVSSTWEVSGGINISELFRHSWGNRDLSFGGGVTATGTRSAVRPPVDTSADLLFEDGSTLLDVNGDGLVDAVQPANGALSVRFNRGDGFGPAVDFGGLSGHQSVEASETFAAQAGGNFTVSIGPLCVVTCYLIINPGLHGSNAVSRPTLAVRDVDGDGFADVVSSSSPNAMSYARNLTGKTGLLRRVVRPLGAEFALDYARAGNTQAMPQSRWVLASVTTYDGVDDSAELGARTDFQRTNITYTDGRYDRWEREFLGFATVTVEDVDTTGWDGAEATLHEQDVYRRTIQRFLNGAIHERGLLAEARLESGTGAVFRTTVNTYQFLDPATAQPFEDEDDLAEAPSVFPALTAVDALQHEGVEDESVARHTEQEYDQHGNVIEFRDDGGLGVEDDLVATIAYSSDDTSCRSAHVVSVPRHIRVVDHAGRLLREREATVDCPTPLVTAVSVTTDADATSDTTLGYDPRGRLESVTYPPNEAGQSYSLTYVYDDVIGAHVKTITDAFGYVSSADHDFRFGAPTREVDINGQAVSTAYDVHGRATRVTGPYEQGSGVATITYAYRPDAGIPWARTSHHDIGRSDRIETYSFVDGLGRALQTKKDATTYAGDETPRGNDVMVVSGRIQFDPWGRPIATWHPTTEALGSGGAFQHARDGSAPPTTMVHDVVDRVVMTTIPGSDRTEPAGVDAVTTQQFSLVPAPGELGLWAETRVVDADGEVREARRDARGRIREVIEHGHRDGDGGVVSATTRYAYDPVDQLVRVTDARGNRTTVEYDLAGRRTQIDSPDAGLTELVYDRAGNVIERITAALRARNESVAYRYDVTHLVAVDHPGTEPDIEYAWGSKDAAPGQRGRITRVTDAAGTVDRQYGPLGEVVRETRRLYDPNESADGDPDGASLTTEFVYDTWGRIRQMTYPDGEVLTYGYDSGGLIRSATGVKLGVTYPYVTRLEYDRFGQRVFEEKGNGIRTHYAYDDETRRLAGLEAGGFQDLEYTYDLVGNVLALTNAIDEGAVPANGYGGRVEQRFVYDGLHRLVHAEGEWDEPGPGVNRYTLDLEYDVIHNLTHKTQTHVVARSGNSEVTQRETTYDWDYTYASEGGQPHAPSRVGDRHFRYDASGRQVASYPDGRGPRRAMLWDSEDRIRVIQDGGETVRDADGNVVAGRGRTTEFVYDAEGQRVFKRGAQGETAYVNPFYTLRNGTVATKHVFVGAIRVTSKLVPGEAHSLPIETDELSRYLGRWWEHRSEEGWEHAQNVEMNPHYRVPTQIPSPMGLPESNFIYFYHPDHLGSTSFVTDGGGEIYEHVQYFPHGDVWADERSNTERIPYLFTGKEFDQETGLYDFGARMYDPRVGLWASPDPALTSYLPNPDQRLSDIPGMGGVFNLPNLNLYGYAQQNPVRLVDPTGEIPVETVWDVLMAFVGARSLWQNIAARNWSAAALDALGLAWDIGAMALPYIPGGAAIIRNGRQALSQARRLSSQLGDAIQHAPPSLRRTLEGLKSKLDEAIDTASRFFDEAASQRAARQAALGVAREQRVAELIGGQAARRQVVVPGVGSTDIDVIGAAGEFVAVGGPAKAGNLSRLGRQMQVLREAAQREGVRAMAYFERGTPEAALNIARRHLGAENVHLF